MPKPDNGCRLPLSIRGPAPAIQGAFFFNIRDLIRDGIAEGELRPFDPDTFIHAYIGVLYRMMDIQAAAQSALTMDKALGPTVDLLLYGILSDKRKEERL
ncbi:hypothetical protein ACF3MZ_30410 [Paenibacillaceae bacterium WGS1546]|uniref:hypothetical protein n=1 Tax=Cohnella sp. WGS1546 TaxID=3366810 RepID=UPI00372D50F2